MVGRGKDSLCVDDELSKEKKSLVKIIKKLVPSLSNGQFHLDLTL